MEGDDDYGIRRAYSGDLQNWYYNAFLRRRKAIAKELLITWRIIAWKFTRIDFGAVRGVSAGNYLGPDLNLYSKYFTENATF